MNCVVNEFVVRGADYTMLSAILGRSWLPGEGGGALGVVSSRVFVTLPKVPCRGNSGTPGYRYEGSNEST